MTYIEIIRLRTTGNYSDEIIQILMETMSTNKTTDIHYDIRFFKNTPLKTDFLVLRRHYRSAWKSNRAGAMRVIKEIRLD